MKVLICDDHQIVRDGLRQILGQDKDIQVINEASNGSELLELLEKTSYEIVILDISLPNQNGLEVLQSIKRKWPATNVLMLSMHPQEQYAIRALSNGAAGYLTKDIAAEELLLAIKKIAAKGKYISPSLADCLALSIKSDSKKPLHEKLSEREFDIMIKLAAGKSLIEIGNELFISNKTVSTYRSRIMEKMNLEKNTDLARYCIENQLI